MKRVGLVLVLVAAVVAACGCARKQAVAPAAPGGIVLAEGRKIIQGGRVWWVDFDGADQPGVLTVTVTWPGPPSKMTATFRHGSSRNRGWTRKRAPVVTRAKVTAQDVAGGGTWRLYLANRGRCGKTAHARYVVVFRPD